MENLTDESELRLLFARIKQETHYDNTFGYDLFCIAMYSANGLLDLGKSCCFIICLPLMILLNVAIYAVAIPTTMALAVVEHLVITPIKMVVDAIMPNEHEEFIQEVTRTSACG